MTSLKQRDALNTLYIVVTEALTCTVRSLL